MKLTKLFIAILGIASLFSCAPKNEVAEDLPVALQLYTVRDNVAEDFPGTLLKVKEMGFDAIQFHDDDAVPNINDYTEAEIIEKAKEV